MNEKNLEKLKQLLAKSSERVEEQLKIKAKNILSELLSKIDNKKNKS